MTTTNYTDADIDFGFEGFFDFTTHAGKRCWASDGRGTWIGYITGTDATIDGSGSGANFPFIISVDGGAETNPTWTGGIVTLFSGLSDTAHLVRIRVHSAFGTDNGMSPMTGTAISVTGAAPAIGQGSDLGPSYIVTDPSFPGYHSFALAAPIGGNVVPAYDTHSEVSNSGFGPGGQIVINAKCTDIWLLTGAAACNLSIDGEAPTRTYSGTENTGAIVWVNVATGLDGSAYHDYWITPGLSGGSDKPTLAVMIGGSGAAFGAMSALSMITQYGDSITWGANGGTATPAPTPRTCDMDLNIYAPALNLIGRAHGSQGKLAADLDTIIDTLLAADPRIPDYAMIAIGYNDSGTASATFKASYTSIINKLLTAGVTKVLCRKIIPDQASNFVANRTQDIIDAVAALADSRVTVIGEDTWRYLSTVEANGGVNGANPNTNGTHPDPAGYVTLANYEIPVLSALFTTASIKRGLSMGIGIGL